MKKQKLIEKLTSNRDKYFEKAKKYADLSWYRQILDAKALVYMQVINWVEQLDEPQAEKVEVPDFVAELICKYKAKKETLVCSISNLYRESDEYKWYVDNAEIYERAWANGYTVEQPKRWVVRQGGSEVWYLQGFRNSLDGDIVKQWCSHEGCIKFTDRKKADAVALLVDGSVEEV